jgi:hypothetical protein
VAIFGRPAATASDGEFADKRVLPAGSRPRFGWGRRSVTPGRCLPASPGSGECADRTQAGDRKRDRSRRGRVVSLGRVTVSLGGMVPPIRLAEAGEGEQIGVRGRSRPHADRRRQTGGRSSAWTRRDASPKPDPSRRRCGSEGRSLSDARVFLGCVDAPWYRARRRPPLATAVRPDRPTAGNSVTPVFPLLNPSATGTRSPPIPRRTPEGFRRRRRASGNGVTVRRQTHSSPGITMAYSPARRSVETTPVFQSRISVGKWLLRARDRRVRRGNGMNDGNAIKRASSTESTGIIG